MNRFSQIDFFLIPILIIGFTLRIVGIGVGLPDYPDPRESLIAQDILNLIHLKALPDIYNWPGTAWFYLIAVIGKILEIFGLHLTVSRVIWIARFTNTLLSTATIWLTYGIGVRFYSRSVGRIAASLLAVTMLHATNESRFALVDIPATFCVALLLWLCAKYQAVSFRRAAWLGVVTGIAFAVKFTTALAGLAVLALFVPLQKQRSRPSAALLKLATVMGVAAASFTLICPYWLIDLFSPKWNKFFDAFFYEASHYQRGHFGLFATGEINWLDRFTYLWTLLRWGMGAPLALLALIGVLVAIIDRNDGDQILLAFVLPYLLFVGSQKLKFVRHLLIIYPALAVFAAASSRVGATHHLAGFWRATPTLHRNLQKWGKGFVVAVLGGSGMYSLIYTAAFAHIMETPPTMREAAEWIEANIPPEESIETEPEILFDWLLPKLDRGYNDESARWVILLMPNVEVFLKYAKSPHSYSAIDWYPLKDVHPELAVEFYKRVSGNASRYKLVRTFQRHPRFWGIPISDRGAPFPMRALAHPEIRIYRR